MLDAAELAELQADAAYVACDKPCVIQRKTKTQDGLLSETEVWTTISPDGLLAGMSQPSGTQLQNFDYKIGSLKAYQVKLPVGTDVREQDLLFIENQRLVVQVDLTPRSYPVLLTLLASEVQ
jgi:hypothetical protein